MRDDVLFKPTYRSTSRTRYASVGVRIDRDQMPAFRAAEKLQYGLFDDNCANLVGTVCGELMSVDLDNLSAVDTPTFENVLATPPNRLMDLYPTPRLKNLVIHVASKIVAVLGKRKLEPACIPTPSRMTPRNPQHLPNQESDITRLHAVITDGVPSRKDLLQMLREPMDVYVISVRGAVPHAGFLLVDDACRYLTVGVGTSCWYSVAAGMAACAPKLSGSLPFVKMLNAPDKTLERFRRRHTVAAPVVAGSMLEKVQRDATEPVGWHAGPNFRVHAAFRRSDEATEDVKKALTRVVTDYLHRFAPRLRRIRECIQSVGNNDEMTTDGFTHLRQKIYNLWQGHKDGCDDDSEQVPQYKLPVVEMRPTALRRASQMLNQYKNTRACDLMCMSNFLGDFFSVHEE
jgi:hypothetical protein